MSVHISSFRNLLDTVLTAPSAVEEAFTQFHGFSIGNQILAWQQCHDRGLAVGPIATYPKWQQLGRQVKKGAKALTLCMPVTCKRTATDEKGEDQTETVTRFVFRPRWFVLAQTDGPADYAPPVPPAFDMAGTLAALQITETDFEATNGNIQGYARGRTIAINPVAQRPFATRIHEIAHVVLGHTTKQDERFEDSQTVTHDEREIEAESVAMLVCSALGDSGIEYSRGYLQAYLCGRPIEERTAQRVFKAADSILRAGQKVTDVQNT
jgi:antirestriction protein ArdC